MDLKDLKLFAVILALVGGLGYLVFLSNWRPTPQYEGAPPKYKQEVPTVQFVGKDDPRGKSWEEIQREGGIRGR
jgi:hypothetical protein